jgi:hypothetical protein
LLLALPPASALAENADVGKDTGTLTLTAGGEHTVTVRTDGWYVLECWGQKGANGQTYSRAGGVGGNGGYVKAEAYLTADTELTVSVGVGGAAGGGTNYVSDSQGGKGGGRTAIQLSGTYLLAANGGGGGGGGSTKGAGAPGGTNGDGATGPADGSNQGPGSYGAGGGGGGAGYPYGGYGGANNTGNGGPGGGGNAGKSYLAAASATLFPKTLTYGASSSTTGEARIEWIGYGVTLDKNGGNSDGFSGAPENGDALFNITAPVKTGYVVEGYYKEPACTTKVAEASGTLITNVSGYTDGSGKWIKDGAATLYTKWAAICAVTLAAGAGGTDGSATAIEGFPALSGITAPVKTGYAVEGYYDDAGFSHKVADGTGALLANVAGYTDGSGKWIKTEAAALYAKWTPKTYAVTLKAGGSGTDGTATATYDSADLITEGLIPRGSAA